MTRLPTLATAGLFAAGLAIFPVSVFAQPNAPMAGHDTKSVPAGKQVLSKDAAKPAPASKDAAKAATAKDTTAKAGSAKAATSTPAKVGG